MPCLGSGPPHTQVRVQEKGCGFSHDKMPFGVAPTSGGLPAAGTQVVTWLGRGPGVTALASQGWGTGATGTRPL